nr:hypothetical protein [Rhodococcus sp. WB9]
MTELQIREVTPDDAQVCGRLMFDAFEALATRHDFPIEAGTPEFADFQIKAMLDTDGIYGLVAERDGHIVGSALESVLKVSRRAGRLPGASSACGGESSGHQSDHCPFDHRFRVCREAFVVVVKSTTTHDPRQGPFD